MTWREHLTIRILLLVARIAAHDEPYADDVKNLANHIAVWVPKGDRPMIPEEPTA